MKTKLTRYLLAALLGVAFTFNLHAQLVPDGGTLTFTGTANLVNNALVVGTNGGNTMLTILAPGNVSDDFGIIGENATSTNNQLRVENSGAVWQNFTGFRVGYSGSGNQLIVTNGGVVAAAIGEIGVLSTSSNNLAVVTGAGSRWTNGGDFYVGFQGAGNQLVVTNGGVVVNALAAYLGYNSVSSNNLAVVTGASSLWTTPYLYVGGGSGNRLVASDGGTFQATSAYVGVNSSSINSRVTVDGGNLIVTNSGGTGTLDIRRGTNVLNAGLIQTDNLLLTNSAGFFEFNGGMLITGGGTVNNGQAFVVGASGTTAAVLDVRNNAPLKLNIACILGANNAAGNELLLTNGGNLIITNSGGTGTLDIPNGTSVLSAGLIQTDNLLLNNSTGFFDFNGGTLIAGGGTVNNGQPFVVGASGTTAAILDVRNNTPLTVNNGFTLGANTAAMGNQMLLTNGGTLSVTGSSVLGTNVTASNNLAVVSGTNSHWNSSAYLIVGYSGSGNRLALSNGCVVATGLDGVLGFQPSASENLAMVTGIGSLWTNSGSLDLGYYGSGNRLVVTNGGLVANANDGNLGVNSSSSNNLAVVTGAGSLWANSAALFVGNYGSGNQLVVSNGGLVANAVDGILGSDSSSSNNLAVVTGTGSLWTNGANFFVGYSGGGNQLMVSDGGMVANAYGNVGYGSTANNNLAVVTGAGSLWANSAALFVGQYGSENQLVASDGGTIQAADAYLGFDASSINNRAMVDGGNLIVTNSAGTAVLDIRRGTNVFNSGLIQADNLLLTNSAGFFDFNGGTLIAGGGTVNNGQPFVVGASGTKNAYLDVVSNTPLTLNNGFILGANTAVDGNQLLLYSGGVVSSSGNALIGSTASKNLVVVDETGSSWTSSGGLYLGSSTAGNRLVVAGGGVLADTVGVLGSSSTANNNLALVRDAGSLWNNSSSLYVGDSGSGNQLVVTNGAVVADTYGTLGNSSTANNNLAVVTGTGSLWNNRNDLIVGSYGKGNQLVVSDGGTVQAANEYLGTIGSGNRVTVEGGNLIITNSGGTGTLNILHGTNILNAGLIQTDNLSLNNSAGFFEFNGGTLITGGGTVNNGQAFVVGNGSSAATYQLNGNGLHTFNNGLVISSSATLKGNGTVAGLLTVQSRGTLSPGAPVGLLVLSNSPVLQGSVLMEIGQTGTMLTNDQIQVAAPLTYGGNLVVSKLGSNALAIGDSFRLFSATSYGGAFTDMILPSPGPGLMWTNQLLVNGSIAVVAQTSPAISSLVKSGTNLMFNVSGGSPGGAYDVLTSTNLALPLSSWSTNSSGNFDWMGNAAITNTINLAEPERYFSVQAFNTSSLLP